MDVTPFPYKEHAVLKAVDIPDHHSYHAEDFHPVKKTVIEFEPHHYAAHPDQHPMVHDAHHTAAETHDDRHVEAQPFSRHGSEGYRRYYVEEPVAEYSHSTWHGRHVDFSDPATLEHYKPVEVGHHLGEGHPVNVRHSAHHADQYQADYDFYHAGEHTGEHVMAQGTHVVEPVHYVDAEQTPYEVKHT